MPQKKKITAILLCCAPATLWGGTGSPSDGLLSFLLLLGSLLILSGILHLLSFLKRRLDNLLEGLF